MIIDEKPRKPRFFRLYALFKYEGLRGVYHCEMRGETSDGLRAGRKEEAVGEDRKQQAQRIRAARDWLDEAGDSLEQGAGLKGDLKVMLAEAELARAKETERPPLWRRCGKRVLPLATALAILSLGLFLQPAAAPPEDSPLPAPAAATTMPQVPARQQEAAEPAASWQEPQGQAAGAKASGGQAREVPQERVAPQAAPAAAAEPEPQREIQAPRPPSPEKQKLMQSAGKALRAS